jgi:2-iminobutanoate/2-iminopropanoate deaminase
MNLTWLVEQVQVITTKVFTKESRHGMNLKITSTLNAPSPGGAYSQAIGAGNLIFTAGQVGLSPVSGKTSTDFREQTRQTLSNLQEVLVASGADLTSVVKTTCLLADITMFSVFNEEYAAFFGEHRPARSTFGVALAGGYLVEIEAIAYVQVMDRD